MRNDSPGITTSWLLLVTLSSLFVIGVISKQSAYWRLRNASAQLVDSTFKFNKRHSLIQTLNEADVAEESAVLRLVYSPAPENAELPNKIILLSNSNDTLLTQAGKVISSKNEEEFFHKLKLISDRKAASVNNFLLSFQNAATDNIRKNYEINLFPDYTNFQKATSGLLASVDANEKESIQHLTDRINRLSNISIGISVVLVFLLLSLAFTVKRILNHNRKIRHDLKESERKYRTLTEQTNEIIERHDAEGVFIFCNDAFKKRMEYKDEELSKLTIDDLLENPTTESDQSAGLNVIPNVKRTFITKSRKKIFLEGTILLEYNNGIFGGATGFYNDVTEKNQLEESLKASELKFRNFFNLAPIPMWVVNPETDKFILVNKAACEHYGFSQKEFMSMTIFDIREQNNFIKEKQEVDRVKEQTLRLSENKSAKFNSIHVKRGGEKIDVEIYTSPIFIDYVLSILAISIDVTNRNQFENRITKAIIKTQEDERYELGLELHDNVCQILAAAKMSLGMIKPSLNAAVINTYNQSYDAIILATKEIRNLSHRLAPAFFDNTKLETAFESLIKSFNIADAYHVSICFDKCSKHAALSQDIQLNLYRILQEQLRNIIQYARCTAIEITVFIKKEKLHMQIADNGAGFDVSLKNNGIGLANMKRRAELFSGQLIVESEKGKGCKVMVVIPMEQTK